MTKTSTLSIPALKACNLFASTEETRYYLRGVCVTVTERATLYVATDGQRLLAHRDELPDTADANTLLGEWILPREAIAALKAGKHNDAITLTQFSEGKLLLGESIVSPIDGTFPDWRRSVPAPLSPEDTNDRPQFNGAYVADFAKAAKILFGNSLLPFFHYAKAINPAAVTFGTHQTFGVLMPLRAAQPDEWSGLPNWASVPPAIAQAAE